MTKLISVLLIAAACAFLAPGCDKTKTAATAGAKAWIACEKADLSQTVSDDGLTLLGKAVSIFQAGGAGWKDALGDLGAKVGELSLACASDAARVALSNTSPHFTIAPPEASGRAAAYIAERGWRFSP